MSTTKTEYEQHAIRYHALGANVVSVGSRKNPNHLYTEPPNDFKLRRQTPDEVSNLVATGTGNKAWLTAHGVGIISGVGGWRCVDFDANKADATAVPFEVVATFCQRLGLDANAYKWVERSGSGLGWHVWIRCEDELPARPGVSWGRLEPAQQYVGMFDHCELRWANCFTIVAPSSNGAYQWQNGEPETAPELFDVGDILYALQGVATIPDNATENAIRSTLNESTETTGELYDPNTGETWATFDQYKADEQRAKDNARERFTMVEYIQRHLGTTWVEQQRDGETRIGKPGAGYGGWFVTRDGKQWNTFRDGEGRTGGDCFALVAYCEFGTTRVVDRDQWRKVLSIVERETGVRFPTYESKRNKVSQLVTSNSNDDGRQHQPTRRADKPTKAELVLEYLTAFRFRRNELSHVIEWQPTAGESWYELSDEQLSKWRVEFELATGTTPSRDGFTDCIVSVTTPYDPIHEYFDALPAWDGTTDHIQQFALLANADDPEDFAREFRKWVIGTYATGYYGAVTHKTINETFLVLQGEQGSGKTTFLTKLIPPALQPYLYCGKVGNDKDGKMTQAGSFVILNDELAGLRKTEVEEVKSLLSITSYRFRKPYGSIETRYKRRVSFCGTTNENQFLNDPTGARRWLVHTIQRVDFEALQSFDVGPLWAQAKALHENGVPHWFTASENAYLNERNKRYSTETYADALLQRYFRPGDPVEHRSRFYTVSELAQRIAELYDHEHTATESRGFSGETSTVRDGTTRPNPERLVHQLTQALRKHGYERKQHRGKHLTTRYGFWVVEFTKDEREDRARGGENAVQSAVTSLTAEPTAPTAPTAPGADWPNF